MEAPKPGPKDTAHTLVGGVVGMVPFAGSLAQAVYQTVLMPPFQRNVQRFLEEVCGLLAQHQIQIDALCGDERFQSAAMQALLVAGRTRDEAKRAALRSAMLNVARRAEDEVHEELFVAWIDALSPTHLLVLDLLDDPPAWHARRGRECPRREPLVQVLCTATGFDQGLAASVVSELFTRELVDVHPGEISQPVVPNDARAYDRNLPGVVPGDRRRTTDLGRRFLVFLRVPPLGA